ncbi:MAG: glutamate mutase L [Chloroflexota bacterium]
MEGGATLEAVLAADIGSTTTKVILIVRDQGRYRLAARSESPTTVEAPTEDVLLGMLAAIRQLEQMSGRRLLCGSELIRPARDGAGCDAFVATSSAGGGLQMLVSGVIKGMTAESAERAALGAGAIVTDVVSMDDGRSVIGRITRIREFRPDIILLSGGTDQADIAHVASMAECIAAANPSPRVGRDYRIPVVYAGNRNAREYVTDVLSETMDVRVVDNLRPSLEVENLQPAREEIHRLFLEHVMARAPGYARLLDWSGRVMMPTPMAVGDLIRLISERWGKSVLAVDIGGATTDVFSVLNGAFTRSVSANIGMSYSLSNVLAAAGVDRIRRWLPFSLSERELRNWVLNKMIRPTTLPEGLDELVIEHAMAREALRLSQLHHQRLLGGLSGVQRRRNLDELFEQKSADDLRADASQADVIVGSGGVLSHAPRRAQSMLLMLDGLLPRGVCHLYVDNIFMLPHIGVLASVAPDAALEVLAHDGLVSLGTCVAPFGHRVDRGEPIAHVVVTRAGGEVLRSAIVGAELTTLPLPAGETAELSVTPVAGWNVGAGRGRSRRCTVVGGACGIVLDGRGRPIALPDDPAARRDSVSRWASALDAYDDTLLGRYQAAAGEVD